MISDLIIFLPCSCFSVAPETGESANAGFAQEL